jgi:CDP-6-deoxy-D-xylo-4-hexulose-3-dehydrase
VCDKYNLYLIEDSCDALGSKYSRTCGGSSLDTKYTGTFGDIATFSFYPAHHITMGEGGAVATSDPILYKIMLSVRDWGRDCWCPTGRDNTCGQRFSQQHGNLPEGYDHKYVYSHLGYNLKITDWQAAIGLAQLEKLPWFAEKRKDNFRLLYDGLKQFEQYLILPRTDGNSDAAWFGFPVTVTGNNKFSRNTLVRYLEEHNIGTRQMFAGNILRQPVFLNNDIKIRIGSSKTLISSSLTEKDYKMMPNTDIIAENTFWIGVWPGVDQDKIRHIVRKIDEFINQKK